MCALRGDRWASEMSHYPHLMVGKTGWESSGEWSEVTQPVSGWGLPQALRLQSKALSCWRLVPIHTDSGDAKAGVRSQQSWTVEAGPGTRASILQVHAQVQDQDGDLRHLHTLKQGVTVSSPGKQRPEDRY